MHLIAPLDKQFSILYGLLTDHISENVDYKVISIVIVIFALPFVYIFYVSTMIEATNAGDCILYNSKSNKPCC